MFNLFPSFFVYFVILTIFGKYKCMQIKPDFKTIFFEATLPKINKAFLELSVDVLPYLLTLPLFAGVSRVRALSPAWTGSHARETLISGTHLFLPHDLPPTKKSNTIKSWPTFCNQYFWKFPIWNFRTDEKRWEIRMVKVFKWYPVIDLFDTFTGKLGHGD